MATKQATKTIDESFQDIVDFYDADMTQEVKGLPTGYKNKGEYYHLVVEEASVQEWGDGRPYVEVRTKVASGELEGELGPIQSYSIGGYTGTTTNADGKEREFTITAAAQAKDILALVRAVTLPNKVKFSHPVGFTQDGEPVGLDETILEEIVGLLEEREFIALVKRNKAGYMRMSKYSDVGHPPEGFTPDSAIDFGLN